MKRWKKAKSDWIVFLHILFWFFVRSLLSTANVALMISLMVDGWIIFVLYLRPIIFVYELTVQHLQLLSMPFYFLMITNISSKRHNEIEMKAKITSPIRINCTYTTDTITDTGVDLKTKKFTTSQCDVMKTTSRRTLTFGSFIKMRHRFLIGVVRQYIKYKNNNKIPTVRCVLQLYFIQKW